MTDNERVLWVRYGKSYSGEPVQSGLVRFRDGKCYLAAPVWGHFVGLTESVIMERCKAMGYQVDWQEEAGGE